MTHRGKNQLNVLLTFVMLTLFSITAIGTAQAANPALIEASRHQDAEAVRLLLTDGADPDSRQADGATALHWAVYREDVHMLGSLIEAGADINIVNRLGTSPLFIAAEVGHAGLIELLLEAGADPNLALQIGETPLMTAARAGSTEGVRLLVEAGADVNASESSRHQTALMWAAAQGHVGVARVLIDAGTNLEARSKVRPMLMFVNNASNGGAFDQGVMENLGGYSALLFAARQGDVAMASLLLNSGADLDGLAGNGATPLVVATHSGHSDFASLLLEQGADADAIGAGYNALHAAVLRGDLDTVVALLDHSADPNVRLLKPNPVQRASEDWALRPSLVGATPYWIAANFREAEIMRALTDGGADALLTNEEILSQPRERADRDSYTPEIIGGLASSLQAAIRGDSTRGRFYVQANPDPAGEERLTLAAVKVAADHGVNLDHTDFTGATALHDAAARGLATVVRELAERGADINALNGRGRTPLDLAIVAARRPSFFGFDLSVPGPSAREVLEEFGGLSSAALQR